jgi:hypothetical protein
MRTRWNLDELSGGKARKVPCERACTKITVGQKAGICGRVSPGIYIDEIGWEYFYLTGIYSKFAHNGLG